MLRVYEFEFYESGGYTVAYPFEIGEGTFGESLRDAAESAADWLEGWLRSYAVRGEKPPEPIFGHEAKHGGRILAVAVDFGLSRMDAMTAADAARARGEQRAGRADVRVRRT